MSTCFSIEHTVFVLNSHRFQGWGQETASFEGENLEVASYTVGPDGKMIGVATGQKGGPITVRVMPNSPTCAWLTRHFQRFRNGICDRFDGIITNHQAGISFTLVNGYFQSGPMIQNMGSEIATQEFVFFFEEIKQNYDGATFRDGPYIRS